MVGVDLSAGAGFGAGFGALLAGDGPKRGLEAGAGAFGALVGGFAGSAGFAGALAAGLTAGGAADLAGAAGALAGGLADFAAASGAFTVVAPWHFRILQQKNGELSYDVVAIYRSTYTNDHQDERDDDKNCSHASQLSFRLKIEEI